MIDIMIELCWHVYLFSAVHLLCITATVGCATLLLQAANIVLHEVAAVKMSVVVSWYWEINKLRKYV